jgi:hypothetical protein
MIECPIAETISPEGIALTMTHLQPLTRPMRSNRTRPPKPYPIGMAKKGRKMRETSVSGKAQAVRARAEYMAPLEPKEGSIE